MLKPGELIGGYRVVRTLGAGGMGTVYLAQHPSLPRRDALKVLSNDLSTDPEFRARFEREANLASALDHPNIVSVFNRGEEDGQLWIAMQYVDGTDASEEGKKGPGVMTPERALHIVSEVGKGLDYAHRRGLLHRDVKPANFLLAATDKDEQERVLLTDFGVAKSAEDTADLTATGNFLATTAYASPEQLSGGKLGPPSDIYSLTCAFYKLVTGTNPYPSTLPAVVMMGHLTEPPPKITETHPELPAALDDVIGKGMAKDPAERFASCYEFSVAAADALHGRLAPGELGEPASNRAALGTLDRLRREAPTRPGQVRAIARQKMRRRFAFGGIALLLTLLLITVLAFGRGLFTGDRGDSDPASAARSVVDTARLDNPQFSGRTLTAVFYNKSGSVAVALDPSPQADFLRQLGFIYNPQFKAKNGEQSPRGQTEDQLSSIKSDATLIVRSDPDARNGGTRGLPSTLLYPGSQLAVLDDPEAVAAFTDWTDESPNILVQKLVPALAKALPKK